MCECLTENDDWRFRFHRGYQILRRLDGRQSCSKTNASRVFQIREVGADTTTIWIAGSGYIGLAIIGSSNSGPPNKTNVSLNDVFYAVMVRARLRRGDIGDTQSGLNCESSSGKSKFPPLRTVSLLHLNRRTTHGRTQAPIKAQ
jgi:hypothetical protein